MTPLRSAGYNRGVNGKKSTSNLPTGGDQIAAVVILGGSLVVGWGLLVAANLHGAPSSQSHVAIGYLMGTVFSQTTVAAAWAALGPFLFMWRIPLSLLWTTITLLAFAVGIAIHSPGDMQVDVLIVMWLCVIGQWLAVQIPLWGAALGWGLRIAHGDSDPRAAKRLQFGIRQLMIVTAIVAAIFGAGRVIVANLAGRFSQAIADDDAVVFVFLAAAGIILTLPLVLATLLSRFALVATAGVTLLIALARISHCA